MLEEEKVVGLTQLAILSTHCDMFWIIERMDLIELFAIFEYLTFYGHTDTPKIY